MSTHSKPVGDTQNQRCKVNAAIPLTRPYTPALVKGTYETMKLRVDPADQRSATYDVIMSYFSTGTPEDGLKFNETLNKVILGQALTGGPAKYAFARRVLSGDAKASFNTSATYNGTETNANFIICITELTRHIFPAWALQNQKRYMRRFLRKPGNMTVRAYFSRVNEINSYLTLFPDICPDEPATSLDNNELLDLMEFGIPASWQRELVKIGFDPTNHTIQEFQEFCERMELTETLDPNRKPSGDKRFDKNDRNKNLKRGQNGQKLFPDEKEKEIKFCLYHGKNPTHNSDECKVLKGQADRMKGTYEATSTDRKKSFKKRQEAMAIGEEVIERRDEAAKKKRTTKEKDDDEIYKFEELKIESDDTPNSSTESEESSWNGGSSVDEIKFEKEVDNYFTNECYTIQATLQGRKKNQRLKRRKIYRLYYKESYSWN